LRTGERSFVHRMRNSKLFCVYRSYVPTYFSNFPSDLHAPPIPRPPSLPSLFSTLLYIGRNSRNSKNKVNTSMGYAVPTDEKMRERREHGLSPGIDVARGLTRPSPLFRAFVAQPQRYVRFRLANADSGRFRLGSSAPRFAAVAASPHPARQHRHPPSGPSPLPPNRLRRVNAPAGARSNPHSGLAAPDRGGIRRGFLPRGLCDACPRYTVTRSHAGASGQASHNP